MRVSRSGMVAAAVYAVVAVGCVAWGYQLDDPTESTVLMQLPVVPVLAVLGALGLLECLPDVPLAVFYGVSVTLVALGLYATVWLFGALSPRARLGLGVCVLGVVSVLTLWPVRR